MLTLQGPHEVVVGVAAEAPTGLRLRVKLRALGQQASLSLGGRWVRTDPPELAQGSPALACWHLGRLALHRACPGTVEGLVSSTSRLLP